MVRPVPLESDVKNRLGLKSSPKLISWVKHDNEVKSILTLTFNPSIQNYFFGGGDDNVKINVLAIDI